MNTPNYLYALQPLSKYMSNVFTDPNNFSTPSDFTTTYWKNADILYKWLVKNVYDQIDTKQYNFITREQLEELFKSLGIAVPNNKYAKDSLLFVSDFFSSIQDYNDQNFIVIQNTIDQLRKAFENYDEDTK